MTPASPVQQFSVDLELVALIAYHKGWKKFPSRASFCMTAFSIVAAAAASVTAGLRYSVAAAILAAMATVFTSLEKVLQFRERWDLHRITEDGFQQIRWERALKGLADDAVADRVNAIQRHYDDAMAAFRVRTTA
jgi:multidrug transporter EmrE-like cation transporter